MPGRGRESVSDFRTIASKEEAAKEVLQNFGNANAFDRREAEWAIRLTQT